MDRPTQAQAEASKIYLLQNDYKKAVKEVKRIALLLKEAGILVD